ncbi:type I polyketide synthase [Corallococcus sicarius]|uniref:Polyketide synthase n=1 Tax=Corallococcus sicarius TaxID=2316726 RepID=A0A3A8NPB8_9BACT|nr:type I polyketide synthase [Corallococcus sicarius]RKH46227.1 polyketide synthase [Corallococcus sicarius]
MGQRMTSAEQGRFAVVGAAGRFPGAADLGEYWRLLVEGRVAAAEPDASRGDLWKAARDPVLGPKITTLRAGYLSDVAGFDAEYFSVSPREALKLDPQQRLLLEVTHDALEDGGITRAELQRSNVGVFIGVGSSDYMSLDSGQKQHVDGYFGIGNSHNLLAGRISYFLNLKGPSLAIDTACSSSLTALHFAMQSLRGGEIDLAIVGGVNVILSADLPLAFSQAKMLSPSGRCKTFSAEADGYGRAEGVAVVVLRRVASEALARHPVRCFIASTAINQDGRSNGIAAPNGASQIRVIRSALERAGLSPADIAYVEAHGTGTPLGDAIELNALQEVFGGAPGASCFVGSAKASIGHAEAAAGLCGLLKGMLILEHGVIPPHPVQRPHAPFFRADDCALRIAEQALPLPEHLRHVGISSFGFGGSNAHVVLERHVPQGLAAVETGRPVLLPLSSHFAGGLAEDAAALASHLAASEGALEPVSDTLMFTREHLTHRRSCVARTRAEAIEALRKEHAQAAPLPVAAGEKPKVAFMFTGQGSQYVGMGRDLYEAPGPFRDAFDACDALILQRAGVSMAQLVYGPAEGGNERLTGDTHAAQLSLFAFEYALASLWTALGVTPAFGIGHSVGELVAHTVSGSLSLADGVALVDERGRLMQSVSHDGAMVAVSMDLASLTALLRELGEPLHVAAVNGRQRVVVSGERQVVEHLCKRLEREQVRFRALRTRHAFHSPTFDDAAARLAERSRNLAIGAGAFPVVGNLDGAVVPPGALGGDYWGRHIAMPVQFSRGVETLTGLGAQVFLEIGPDRVLSQLVAADHGARVRALSSVVRDRDARESLLRAVGAMYELGFDLDFAPLGHAAPPGRISLPARRLARKRYWTASATDLSAPMPSAPVHVTPAHPPPRERAVIPDTGTHGEPDAAVHALIDRQINVMRQQLALLDDQ